MEKENSLKNKNDKPRLRVGVLIPSTDITVETDLKANLQDTISFHSARMYLKGVTVEDEEKMLVEEVPLAARNLVGVEPNIAVFACTSAGALFGPEGDIRLKEQIKKIMGCPVITVFGSILKTLKKVKPKRLAIITPYTHEVNQRLVNSIEATDIQVKSIIGMDITHDLDIAKVPEGKILKLINQQVLENHPDCVFLSCTNLRAWEVLSIARDIYQIPIISSNFIMYREILNTLRLPSPDIMDPKWG